MIDKSILEYPLHIEPEEQADNLRIYILIDLNQEAILWRLDRVIAQYGEITEENEIVEELTQEYLSDQG